MQTIGERLEEARKKKGISIREAAEATKIRGDYLQKFESNHFDIGLTEIYTRGFLRTYANFLKLPAERIINDYSALGRGDVRPRQPSREVYGRMDISVATTEPNDRAAPAPEAAPEPSPANRAPQRPRTGSSLPTGPDPATIFKYAKWGVAVVILILVAMIINAIFGGRRSTPQTPPAAAVPRGPTIGLHALRPVSVIVAKRNPDMTDGEVLFQGRLAAGESRTVPRPGAVYITADPAENLDVEFDGSRTNWGRALAAFGAKDKGQLEAPK